MKTSISEARWTGLAYLGLAISGMVGFLLLRPQIHVVGDGAATLANIESTAVAAHALVGLELVVVITQALAAVGFYAVFRHERPVAAFAVATFGMANAAALLVSAGATLAAVSAGPELGAAAVGVMFALSDAMWVAGAVFFGLWLIPMGWFAVSTRRFPIVLGWILIAGGAGYMLSALLGAVGASTLVIDVLAGPATVGELWMIGYLLVRGIRPSAPRASTLAPSDRVRAGA